MAVRLISVVQACMSLAWYATSSARRGNKLLRGSFPACACENVGPLCRLLFYLRGIDIRVVNERVVSIASTINHMPRGSFLHLGQLS
jgi:hypothetical protein